MLERQTVLDGLDTMLGKAAWDGGRLVVVRGEAGIGKSTLVRAFTAGRLDKVLWGTCDPVALPQPLGPILDMASLRSNELGAAVRTGDRHRVSSAVLGLLRAEGGPWIVVVEDVQWADEATLELLKVVARRIDQIPALMLVTVRDEESGPEHPFSVMLGDVPSTSVVSLPLPPLSVAAVQELSEGSGIDPVLLHEAAAGNPFFVTEVIAAGGTDLPVTVRDAVMARTRRLPAKAQAPLRAAAVLGQRSELDAVCRVSGAAPSAVAECVAHGMLRQDGTVLAFSHELARRAVLDSLSATERVRLHGRALAVLSERPGAIEPAELAHHAIEAGDAEAVVSMAPRAAARAAALGAHRAALALYDAALPFAARMPPAERAGLLITHASECYVADDFPRALVSQREAIVCWREVGDVEAEAEAMIGLALYEFWAGDVDSAFATAEAAMAHQDSISPGPGLARAAARMTHLMMVSGRTADAIAWGTSALELAAACGENAVVVHVLNTVGCAECMIGDEHGFERLEESLRLALAADLEDDIARAYNNLIANAHADRRYDLFDRYADEAVAFSVERDLDFSRRCLQGDVVESLLDRGRWDEACEQATAVVEGGWRSGRLQSLWVRGLLAARRGEADPFHWLDPALEAPGSSMGPYLIAPLRAARAEAAWLGGDLARAAAEVRAGEAILVGDENGWLIGELAFWAWKLDPSFEAPRGVASPYALLFSGSPGEAAAAWSAIGCPYREAQALAESDREADLRRALAILLDLGAQPFASMVAARLKERGARGIARGPRSSTRNNPAGLSQREMEVALLLSEGLRNAEIADRLVISPKTVDHHVSSVLTKLGARDRHDAARRAADLGITGPAT